MYLDVRLLINRILSKDQRKLFALQRDRLPMLEEEESFESELHADQDIRYPEAMKEFANMIAQYKIETDLDRKLLLGVFVRDCHIKLKPESIANESDIEANHTIR